MNKLRAFLFGILLGQLVMVPYVIHLINTPRIEALVIPDWYQAHRETFHFQIKNVHNKYHVGGDTLNIYIAPEARVNAEQEKQFKNSVEVEGFYNVLTNTIWCVYDPQVLVHELRHVFEGEYHR